MLKYKDPTYLRDMNKEIQNEYLQRFRRDNRFDLIKAYDEYHDIIVGYFLPIGDEFIED